MLAYSFGTLHQGALARIDGEKFETIHDMLCAILATGIASQARRGLYREYTECIESISTVRGKINLRDTLHNQMSGSHLVTCEVSELSVNNTVNRILKTTALLLIQHAEVDSRWKDRLRKTMWVFSDVDTIELQKVRWDHLCIDRCASSCQVLLGVCRLVQQGLLLTTEQGRYKLASFFDDAQMSQIYERFLLAYYKKEWPSLNARAAHIPWALDDGFDTLLPVMRTDIMLHRENDVLILDAKYYGRTMQSYHNTRKIRSEHLYQIFAYVKNKEQAFGSLPHTVSGLVLYAATEESVQPNQTYQMSGNRISVSTLDLNMPFSLIAGRLDAIAGEHFHRAKKGR